MVKNISGSEILNISGTKLMYATKCEDCDYIFNELSVPDYTSIRKITGNDKCPKCNKMIEISIELE